MKKLILLLATLVSGVASAQISLDNVFKHYKGGETPEDIINNLGPGKWDTDDDEGALIYKVRDEIDSLDVRGEVVFVFKKDTTWYNTEYDGLDRIRFEGTIPTLNERDEEYDRDWDWNWSLFTSIRSEFYAFRDLDSSEGPQSVHFFEIKKDKTRVRGELSVTGRNEDKGIYETMEVNLEYYFDKH